MNATPRRTININQHLLSILTILRRGREELCSLMEGFWHSRFSINALFASSYLDTFGIAASKFIQLHKGKSMNA
jgi:hypothetical protein